MFKYLSLILVLSVLEVLASPSVSGDGVRSLELSDAIERAVAAAITRTAGDLPATNAEATTIPALLTLTSREELATLVRTAVEQAVNELTPRTTVAPPPPTCDVEVANAARNLSGVVAQLRALVALAQDCERRVATCERALDEATRTVAQPTTTTTTTTTPAPPRCARGYEYWNGTGHCYRLYQELEIWPLADEVCSGNEGYLAIINSREEAQHLTNICRGNPCFVGVYRNVHDRWATTRDDDVALTAEYPDVWAAGEPNSGKEYLYGYLYEGQLKTANSEQAFFHICEMESGYQWLDWE